MERIVECVLQGERSLFMQFSMKVTVGVLFISGYNKDHALILQDLGGIAPEPFENCWCGYFLNWQVGKSLASHPGLL